MLTPAILAATLAVAAAPELRLPVVRDTWFSDFPAERDGNLGGEPRLKLKSIQELSAVDIDPAPLKGRTVRKATLHLRLAVEPRLRRITVGSLGAPWVEGTSLGYRPQAGSSDFLHARHPDAPWTRDGGDLCRVMLGLGGTLWRMADATEPDARGWQHVPVDPLVVAARVAGISDGFVVFDDTGSEWARDGEKFTYTLFPNRFVASREARADAAPYFTVEPGPDDREPPAAPGPIAAETDGLPAGEARLSWATPADAGPAGTLGFFVRVGGHDAPRDLIPPAGAPGAPVRMHLRDLGLGAGAEAEVEVRAVDGAGNVGPPTTARVRVADRVPRPLPGRDPEPFAGAAPLPKLGAAEVAVVDELDKIHPVNGAMIPPQPAGYLAANHLWDARTRQVRLHAARNEFVAFQLVIRGPLRDLRPTFRFDGGGIGVAVGRYRHVNSKLGPLPDPIVPLDRPFTVPTPDEAIAGQASGSLHFDLYVPHTAEAGQHKGSLTLSSADQTLKIDVNLTVWDVTLPDYLSFLPEMNCYGLPPNERDYYRLAHRHRTVLNRLPYGQNGTVADGCAPAWDGRSLDFADWDRRFGPLLDGSAFADLPRKGVPVDCFYLPIHENWPTPMAGHYNGSYWADRAFDPAYRRALVECSRQFADHINGKGWNDTFFHYFLNNKVDYKRNGWSRGSSPWLLDEPANFQDYWALRWFGVAMHEGIGQSKGDARLVYRCDISRPQWQRDSLDPVLDYNVVGGAFRTYRRIVLDRKAALGQLVVEYGGSNAIEEPNTQPLGWSLDAWSLGADGVLPWQTVGRGDSWQQADPLALFYPGRDGGGPAPSVRLKAYRRGQQDVELLVMLSQLTDEPTWAVGQRVREYLRLAGERKGSGFAGGEDAGVIQFGRLRPQDAWRLRVRLGEALSALHPAPERRRVDLRTPRRDVDNLPTRYVAGSAPTEPAADAVAAAPTATRIIRGRAAVRDALLDFDRPDTPLGAEPRNNALRRSNQVNALLLRFDLASLKDLKPDAIQRATVRLFVWDPSSQGRTKLCAFPLKTPWAEPTATWSRPSPGAHWRGGPHFDLADDAGPPGPPTIVPPDDGPDIADPPRELSVDVTPFVRDWLAARLPNHGLALSPVPDRTVDDGQNTRFQFYTTEANRPDATPALVVEIGR